jgi:hypothetical protein
MISLVSAQRLSELEIRDNNISRDGFLALSKLLQQPQSKIYCLKVGESTLQNSFDDEFLVPWW